MVGRRRRRDRLLPPRCNAETSEHRIEWHDKIAQFRLRFDKRCSARVHIHVPFGQIRLRQLADVFWIDDVFRDGRTAGPVASIWLDIVQLDDQRAPGSARST